ncbi:anthranilate synthase component II [Staphylococcus kloosii]|jgi:para-aminobenzoate synthetase component 2|uniref:anthranilate synthase component II n=1 Tax=Staphylococcus kloosii TaxID=29384 RepID=UPI0018A0AD4F|nr:aminodeoxychorismate/anthranilate synthase component II [Staphylococcus kloosii]MBF7028669.1 aminodeoxychorismate/anthranilate synthase component II [Staphylococcus kloosii]
MIIVIDNKDSFTYNLVDYTKNISQQPVKVIDVDHVDITALQYLKPEAIIISPGPGKPSDYPVLSHVITTFAATTPILGVCLGFQLIVEYFGGKIIKSDKPVHGHVTTLTHTNSGIFKGLKQNFQVMRYHSLIAHTASIPSELNIVAYNEEQIIMAVEHEQLPLYGVQYHPESILSEYGHKQLQLFLAKAGEHCAYSI